MKYLSRTLISVSLISVLTLFSQVGLGQPIFRFPYVHAPLGGEALRLSEREVQLILERKMTDFSKDFGPQHIPALAHELVRLCHFHRLDPALVLALIQVESRFSIDAISPAGARGLMQLMPGTAIWMARTLGYPVSRMLRGSRALDDPFLNLRLGVAYLAVLRDRYQGLSPYFLFAAYNMGPARIDELRARPGFRPGKTRKYYEAVLRGAKEFSASMAPNPLPSGA